jgi:hypothetical protein
VLASIRGRRAALVVICLATGCAAVAKESMSSARMAPSQPAPQPLDRSLFARDPNGALSEEALQKILASPIELALPARVGVLPIMTAKDWRGPGPDDRVPAGVAPFVGRLRRDASFSLVTETMVIPSGALGMEALREIAARYRLRYLVLYREVLAKHSILNAWAWGFVTGIGALFLPGQNQQVYGYIEASMFDVKTGLLMFTTRRGITASQSTNNWHQDEKIDQLASNAVAKYSPDLAVDVLSDLRRFAAAALAENGQHSDQAQASPSAGGSIVKIPPADGATVAN